MTWHNVVNHGQHTGIEAHLPMAWHTFTCTDQCPNHGPWRVYVGTGEVFICSVCRRQFTEVLVDV